MGRYVRFRLGIGNHRNPSPNYLSKITVSNQFSRSPRTIGRFGNHPASTVSYQLRYPPRTAPQVQHRLMLHSIVIPHRRREKYLKWCLTRLLDVMDNTGGVEIIIVNGHQYRHPETSGLEDRIRVITIRDTDELFNKPKYLNVGIEHACGDVLTFLDCDAIVGERFFESAWRLVADETITRLCYRVRVLPADVVDELEKAKSPELLMYEWFEDYDCYHLGFEGYVEPHLPAGSGEPVFGNSQFSMRRRALRGLRFNEDFTGRGFEDLWMIREIWRHYGDKYRGVLVDDAEHAMFHIRQTEQ